MSAMPTGMYQLPEIERVIFGRPAAGVLAEECARLQARRVFILAGRTLATRTDEVQVLVNALGERHAGTFIGIAGHTPREDVVAATQAAVEASADLLVTIGGGSVTDAGKMVSLCLANGVRTIDDLDPLRSAGRGVVPGSVRAPSAPEVRVIAIPVTLSAGEFTAYAGCTDVRHGVKESYRHPCLVPRIIILDPAVTRHTPRDLWLSTGVRAIDHAVEDICSIDTQPFSEGTALHAIRLLARALPRCAADPGDLAARLDCQIGMWLSTIGSQTGVRKGASHAIGHVLGGAVGVPHGVTSCVMLASVLRWNAPVNATRQRLVSEAMGEPSAAAGDLIEALVRKLELPSSLAQAGVGRARFQEIADKAMDDPWTHSNPRPIRGPEQVLEILEAAAGD